VGNRLSCSYSATHVPDSRLPQFVCLAVLAAVMLGGCRKPAGESSGVGPGKVPAPAGSLFPAAAAPAKDELPLPVAVAKILEAAQRTGSVVERCQCVAGSRMEEAHFVPADLPQQPLEEAMQEIKQRYREIRWSGAARERVRVADASLHAGLLKVRIKEFLVVEDRPPQASLPALWQTPEVQGYMRKHGMRVARSARPAAKVARTSPTIIQTKGATVEQILDRMVEGYRSESGQQLYRAWAYRECRRKSGTLIEISIF
jgi:hypothetical protein